MVAEVLQLADAFTETPGRKMTLDTFWGVLSKATTVLEKTAEGENVDEESANMSGRSDSEIALVSTLK